MKAGPKNVFEPDLNPQNSPQRPKKGIKRPQIWPKPKQKDRAVLPKPKLIDYLSRFQKCF